MHKDPSKEINHFSIKYIYIYKGERGIEFEGCTLNAINK